MKARVARAAWAAIFLGPSALLVLALVVAPLLAGVALSLTDFDLYGIADLRNVRFVGLGNYAALLSNPRFWAAVGHTATFVLTGVPLSLAVSLGGALLLSACTARWGAALRTAFLLPTLSALVAGSIAWRQVLAPDGLANAALARLGAGPVDWLGDARFALPSLVLLATWKSLGFNLLLFLAALRTTPRAVLEAAEADGAGPLARFAYVTLPTLRPAAIAAAVLTMLAYVQLFAEPYLLTRGGPFDATMSVVLFMYEEGFRWWRMGSAAAVAIVLTLLTVLVTLVPLRLLRGRAA